MARQCPHLQLLPSTLLPPSYRLLLTPTDSYPFLSALGLECACVFLSVLSARRVGQDNGDMATEGWACRMVSNRIQILVGQGAP